MDARYNRQLLNRILGRKIREKRIAERSTQEALAEDVGIDDKHLGKIECGETLPNAYTHADLEIALDLHTDDYLQQKRRWKDE